MIEDRQEKTDTGMKEMEDLCLKKDNGRQTTRNKRSELDDERQKLKETRLGVGNRRKTRKNIQGKV